MILRYVDAKILPGYAAVDRGRVFGYSFFVYEGSKGVIGDLYVTNGTRLPNAREVELKLSYSRESKPCSSHPEIHRVEAQLLAHEANAVSRPFSGYGISTASRACFMTLALGTATAETIFLLPADVEIRPWLDRRLPAFSSSGDHRLVSRPRRWPRSTTSTTRSADRCAFLNNIVRFSGMRCVFDAESSFVAVDRKSKKNLVGLILCSRVRERCRPRHASVCAAGVPVAADWGILCWRRMSGT